MQDARYQENKQGDELQNEGSSKNRAVNKGLREQVMFALVHSFIQHILSTY